MARYFFIALFAFLGLFGGGQGWLGFTNQNTTSFFLFWSLGLLLFSLLEWRRRLSPEHFSPGVNVFLAGFFVWGIFGPFYSLHPETSFYFSAKYAGALIFILALGLYLNSTARLRQLLWVIFLIAAGQTLVLGVVQAFHPSLHLLGIGAHNNSNNFANYLLFPAAAGSYLFCTAGTAGRRNLTLGLLTLVFGHLWMTHSRAGIAAGFILVAVMCLGLFQKKEWWKSGLLMASFAGGYLLQQATLLLLDPASTGTLADKLSNMSSLFIREVYWHAAWNIFMQHPLTGSGPWTYLILAPLQNLPYVFSNEFTVGPKFPYHAHNLFLHTSSDMGLIGLGLLVASLVAFYKTVAHSFKNGNGESSMLALALGSGMTGYLAQNLFEYCWAAPVFLYTVTFWIMASRVLQAPKRLPSIYSSILHFSCAAAGLAGAVVLALFFSYTQLMERVASPGDPFLKKWNLLEEAKVYCPVCDQPYVRQAYQAVFQFETTRDPKWRQRASDLLAQARQRSPFNQDIICLEGLLYEVDQRYAKALNRYTQCARHSRKRKQALSAIERIGRRFKEKLTG